MGLREAADRPSKGPSTTERNDIFTKKVESGTGSEILLAFYQEFESECESTKTGILKKSAEY